MVWKPQYENSKTAKLPQHYGISGMKLRISHHTTTPNTEELPFDNSGKKATPQLQSQHIYIYT